MSDDAILISELRRQEIHDLHRLIDSQDKTIAMLQEKYYEGLDTIITLEKEIMRLKGG